MGPVEAERGTNEENLPANGVGFQLGVEWWEVAFPES